MEDHQSQIWTLNLIWETVRTIIGTYGAKWFLAALFVIATNTEAGAEVKKIIKRSSVGHCHIAVSCWLCLELALACSSEVLEKGRCEVVEISLGAHEEAVDSGQGFGSEVVDRGLGREGPCDLFLVSLLA